MDDFITKLLSGKKHKTDLVDQLFKIPRPDKKGDNTTFQHVSTAVFQNLVHFIYLMIKGLSMLLLVLIKALEKLN